MATMHEGIGESHLNPVVNTNGAENTKMNRRKFTMCRYWKGILVLTIRSMCLNASRHPSRSW